MYKFSPFLFRLSICIPSNYLNQERISMICIYSYIIVTSYCVTELLDTDLKRVIDKEHAKLN